MATPKPGDVVTVDFLGATGVKRRPAIVVSSDTYHRVRPDVILGVVTTNISAAHTSMDCELKDWSAAGLRAPSAFRSYVAMAHQRDIRVIGHLSDSDWAEVLACIYRGIA